MTQRQRGRPPRAWRLAVPVLGLAGFVAMAALSSSGAIDSTGAAVVALAGGCLLLALGGVVVAGPWVAVAAARLLARTARSAPARSGLS